MHCVFVIQYSYVLLNALNLFYKYRLLTFQIKTSETINHLYEELFD